MDYRKNKDVDDDVADRCAFCGCPVGGVDLWDNAAMAAEEALQDAFEFHVMERLVALVEDLMGVLHEARKAGWSAEAAHRGTGTDGEA